MKVLIKEKLSPHKSKTPEGYLICQDAILARTGKQEYLKSELFPESDSDEIIAVDRRPEEVFSPATLASFENKPVTVEHPMESVTPANFKDLAVGFVRDIKQSKVNGQDVIIGNLIITDEETIRNIEDGVRTELSCGYDCDITDGPNPQQVNIRGNHVALCEQGRAGIAKIIDSATNVEAHATTKDATPQEDLINNLRRLIKEEADAIESYQKAINETGDTDGVEELFKHIQKEEEEHLKELKETLRTGKPEIMDDSAAVVEDTEADKKDILTLCKEWCDKLMDKAKEEDPENNDIYRVDKGSKWYKILKNGDVVAFVDDEGKIYLADTETRPFQGQRGDITQPPLSIAELKKYRMSRDIENSNKYIIYKENGYLKGTTYDNYTSNNVDESKIEDLHRFNNFEEAKKYILRTKEYNEKDILNGAQTTHDSFVVKKGNVYVGHDGNDTDDFNRAKRFNNEEEADKLAKNVNGKVVEWNDSNSYSESFYNKKKKILKEKLKEIKEEDVDFTEDTDETEYNKAKNHAKKAIKEQLRDALGNGYVLANINLDGVTTMQGVLIAKNSVSDYAEPIFTEDQMLTVDEALKRAKEKPEWQPVNYNGKEYYETVKNYKWETFDVSDMITDN